MDTQQKDYFTTLVALVWAGLILGVSFFAAPVKFLTPGVSMEQLLAVGKMTFQTFSWVELAAVFLLVIASVRNFSRPLLVAVSILVVLVLLQKFIVLPALDLRLDSVVASEAEAGSYAHYVYIAIDIVKVLILVALPKLAGRRQNEIR